MTVVNHTLHRPGGAAAVGVTVNVRLVVSGYVTSSKVGILSSTYTTTDAAGSYSVDLTAQSAISPAGTYYIVTHELLPHVETLTIQVPDGAGPFDLVDCLVTDLIPPGVTAVTSDALTQRLSSYAPGGSAGNIGTTQGDVRYPTLDAGSRLAINGTRVSNTAIGAAIVPVTDPKYGAVAAVKITDAAVTASSTSVTSPGGQFTPAMNGQYFHLRNAGTPLNAGGTAPWTGVPLIGTFTYVSATAGTLSVAAGQTVSGAKMSVGPDCTAAINAALADGLAYIPASTDCFIAGELSIPADHGRLVGFSWASRLISATAKANGVTSYATNYPTIENLTLIGTGLGSQPANTTPVSGAPVWANSGCAVIFAATTHGILDNVRMLNWGGDGSDSDHNGVAGAWITYGCSYTTVDGCLAQYCRNGFNEDNFFNSTVNPVPIFNIIANSKALNCRFGFAYQSGSNGRFSVNTNCYAYQTIQSGYDINAQNYITIIGSIADTCGRGTGAQTVSAGFAVYSTGSQNSFGVKLIGCSAYNCGTHGYKFSDLCFDWELTNCEGHSNAHHGALFANGSASSPVVMNGTITGNRMTGNGLDTGTGPWDGFHFTNVTRFKISQNVGLDRQGTPTQRYALAADGTSDSLDLSDGNDFTGYAVSGQNTTLAPISIVGASSRLLKKNRASLIAKAVTIDVEPFSRQLASNSAAPAAGDARGTLVVLAAGESISAVYEQISVAGSSMTLVKFWVIDATTLKYLAVSASVHAAINGATGKQGAAMTSTYVNTTASDQAVYIGATHVAGTAPTLHRAGNLAVTDSAPYLAVSQASQTDAVVGNTATFGAASSSTFWFGALH